MAQAVGGLLIARLGGEVAQARWIQLSVEERQRLGSAERWRTSLNQLGASIAKLLEVAAGVVAGFSAWIAERRKGAPTTKRWVRPEATGSDGAPAPDASTSAPATGSATAEQAPEATPATTAEPAASPDATEESPADSPADSDSFAADPDSNSIAMAATAPEGDPEAAEQPVEASEPAEEEAIVVSGFDEIDALLAATEPGPDEASGTDSSPSDPAAKQPGEPEAG